MKRKYTRREIKEAFSPKAHEGAMRVYNKIVKNKMARKQIRAITKAIDGKKIRNTSGV